MKFIGRVRLMAGLIAVVAVVVLLFTYLNYSMSHVSSREATLEADQYAVSVEYGGLVEKQYVTSGDMVNKNDPLFEINSSSLASALKSDKTALDSLVFDVTDSGNILLKAANDGTVRQVNFTEGAYAPNNSELATIALAGTDYISAKFLLKAPDYARINRTNALNVTLPDNQKLEAKVFDISLEQDGEGVYTIVKARLQKDVSIPATFTTGTPVQANWELESNGWYDVTIDLLKRLFKPVTEVAR
jgi:hypothetical protein